MYAYYFTARALKSNCQVYIYHHMPGVDIKKLKKMAKKFGPKFTMQNTADIIPAFGYFNGIIMREKIKIGKIVYIFTGELSFQWKYQNHISHLIKIAIKLICIFTGKECFG